MLATTRAAKPKLSLSISTATASARPSLSLPTKSPVPRTPISPSPLSPTAYNTQRNARGLSTAQAPTFAYPQSTTTKSILKRGSHSRPSPADRRIQFDDQPVVHCITPVAYEGDGAAYVKVTRDMRWSRGY